MSRRTGNVHLSKRVLHLYQRNQLLLNRLEATAEPQALVLPGSPEPRGSIIVFPGSFNPPTIAHLALLQQGRQFAREYRQLRPRDQPISIYVAFSKQTIDKEGVERPLLLDRLYWMQVLLRHHLPEVGLLLFNRGLYVEQAQAISAHFPKVRRRLFLMGYDKVVQILDPRYYQDRDGSLRQLFSQAGLLVAPRGRASAGDLQQLLGQPENQPFSSSIQVLPLGTAYRDISSSRVRSGGSAYQQEVPPEIRRFLLYTRAYDQPIQDFTGHKRDIYATRMQQLLSQLYS